ncbi:hypothetical protein SK128_022014 [Halocaridina rubra]|uniref:Charged multivesicular body protein 7 n=1 Tax=Halocaridina rubra TaxID=373956 RepID=A0AAN8WTK1_HALRR
MDNQRIYLPPEWSNEERMRVLMGPMPPSLDTVATTGRLTFWTAAVHQWCSTMKKLTFTLQDCLFAFTRGTQQPRSLPDVLLHMYRTGEVVPLDELYLGERNEESWIGWGLRIFISSPSRFAWRKAKDVLGMNNIQGKVFVNVKVLQEMCEYVSKAYWESLSNEMNFSPAPLSLASLYQRVRHCVSSADDLRLVVESLTYHGRATTVIHKDTIFVKFAMVGDTKKPVITKMELAMEDLQSAQCSLESNILKLNAEISCLHSQVMSALKDKMKTKALSFLRKKKRTEKSLETQMKALENVASCQLQLQEAQINKQVIGAFRTGVEAIRASVIGNHSPDRVAETMDDLQEVLGDVEDVGSLIASGVSPPGTVIDDDDLTEELNQLLMQNQNTIDQSLSDRMQGLELPDVPRNNPLSSLTDLPRSEYSPP